MSTPTLSSGSGYVDYPSLVTTSDKCYELLDGGIVIVSSPTTDRAPGGVAQSGVPPGRHVRAPRLRKVFDAPMDVVFGKGIEREVAQPDLVVVRAERRAIMGRDAIQGAHGLMVQILSSGTRVRDRGYKKSLYVRFGVAE